MLSTFALNFNLCRYNEGDDDDDDTMDPEVRRARREARGAAAAAEASVAAGGEGDGKGLSARSPTLTVGQYRLKPHEPRVESALCQCLKLHCKRLVASFAFSFNLCRYITASSLYLLRGVAEYLRLMRALTPSVPVIFQGLCALFEAGTYTPPGR